MIGPVASMQFPPVYPGFCLFVSQRGAEPHLIVQFVSSRLTSFLISVRPRGRSRRMFIGFRGVCFFGIGESVSQFQFVVSHKLPQVPRIGWIIHIAQDDLAAIRAGMVFHDHADQLCLAGPPQVVLLLSFDLVFAVINVMAFQMIVEQREQFLGAGWG